MFICDFRTSSGFCEFVCALNFFQIDGKYLKIYFQISPEDWFPCPPCRPFVWFPTAARGRTENLWKMTRCLISKIEYLKICHIFLFDSFHSRPESLSLVSTFDIARSHKSSFLDTQIFFAQREKTEGGRKKREKSSNRWT